MDLGLTGKTAYVTGTAMGIGQDIVRLLAAEGVTVFAVDLDGDTLNSYVSEENLSSVTTFVQDLSTLEGCRTAAKAGVEALGGAPDILINNVGAGKILNFEDIDDDQWHRTFELNFFAMVRTCSELLPLMQARGGGAVVNVASDLGKQPEPAIVDYAASKAAMLSVAQSLALSQGPVDPGELGVPRPDLDPVLVEARRFPGHHRGRLRQEGRRGPRRAREGPRHPPGPDRTTR